MSQLEMSVFVTEVLWTLKAFWLESEIYPIVEYSSHWPFCAVRELHEVNLIVQKKEPFKKETFSSEDMASDRDTVLWASFLQD